MLVPILNLDQTRNRNSYKKRAFEHFYSVAELMPLFRSAMQVIFGKNIKPDDLNDFAAIAAFLTSPLSKAAFYTLDEELQAKCRVKLATPVNKFRLSEVIVEWLHTDCGFSDMQGVVLSGDATLSFRSVVGNGIIFKDGFSPVHGEFTHAFQWLLIAIGVGEGTLPLSRPAQRLCELYSASVRIERLPGIPDFVGEFGQRRAFVLWDFIGDCFLDPTNQEDLLDNLLTASFRGPANIQKFIMEAEGSFLKEYYTARFYKASRMTNPQDFNTSIGHNDKRMQAHHATKQLAKGSTPFVGNAWGPAELGKYLAKQK